MSVGESKPNVYFGPSEAAAGATYSLFNPKGTKSSRDIVQSFKQIPNATMRGTTFDVRHLDHFI